MIAANNANTGGRDEGSWHGSREVVCAVALAMGSGRVNKPSTASLIKRRT